MTHATSSLNSREHQPNFATLDTTPVTNGNNQIIVNVSSAAIPNEIPPLREATAATSKILQFPYGSRPILKDGIIVHIPNPAPLVGQARISTVQDLPPEEDPSVTEMRQTVRETTESLKKFEDRIRADSKRNQEMWAGVEEIGITIEKNIASTQKIIDVTQEIHATTQDMIQRVDRLIEKSTARTLKTDADITKIILQTEQLEALNRRLDQNAENGTVHLVASQEPSSTLLSESNFLARNWKIVSGRFFCMITLVAIAAIFGIATAIVSTILAIGTAFWTQYESKTSNNSPTQSFYK